MRVIADLHLHSKYARATSKKMDIENLAKYGKLKGLNLITCGDFTFPNQLADIKQKLKPIEGTGLYEYNGMNFMLTTEMATFYYQDKKFRRVHHVVHVPSLEIVEQIIDILTRKGANTGIDGRMSIKISSSELVETLMEISKDIEVVPAHLWTPFYGCMGSKTGFDSIRDCYLDQTKNIHALETGLSCYDEKTEVLTNNGWKKFTDVCYTDKICTLNLKTDEIEFQNPLRIFSYDYKGKMYRLKTKRVDLLVTPNHKILVGHCNFRKPVTFSLKEAKFVFNKSKRFKKNGSWKGKTPKYFILPAVKIRRSRYSSCSQNRREKHFPMKPWLKFFGLWLANGWITQNKNGNCVVHLSGQDENLLLEIKKILKSFGYKIYHDRTNRTIKIRDFQLFHYLKQFGRYDKFIPSDIKLLSKELLEILLNYFIRGKCGYRKTKKRLYVATSSIRLRDDLQEIALKVGMSAYYSPCKKRGGCKQRKDTWKVCFIRKNIHTVLPSTIKKFKHVESWVDFEGRVFCVSVPNQIIYVRRNGIPVWCGNSDPPMNWRLSELDDYALMSNSDSHSPWPWRLGRECNVFDLKKLTYWNLWDAVKKKDPKRFLFTIEVDPSYGKYHYTGHRNCNVSLHPEDALKLNNICPRCGRKLTVGVLQRVEELADRPEGFVPKNAIPFKSLLPLYEIISHVTGTKQLYSQKVVEEQDRLIRIFGNELNILLNVPKEELVKVIHEKIADGIIKVRDGRVKYIPGADGKYGYPVFDEQEFKKIEEERKSIKIHAQKSLMDFQKGP